MRECYRGTIELQRKPWRNGHIIIVLAYVRSNLVYSLFFHASILVFVWMIYNSWPGASWRSDSQPALALAMHVAKESALPSMTSDLIIVMTNH